MIGLWLIVALCQPEAGPVVAPPPIPPIPAAEPVSTGTKDLFMVRFEPVVAADGSAPRDADRVAAVVRRQQRALRACYESMLRTRQIVGRGQIEVTFDANGRVTMTRVVDDDITDREVLPCMARVLRRARMAGTGAPFSVRLPFVFMPAE